MPNPHPNLANLGPPFFTGDPRINRKGRPPAEKCTLDLVRRVAAEVINEVIEIEKGEKITRLKGMIRARVLHANEGDGQAFRDVLTILCGKKWEEVNQQINIQSNNFRRLLTDDEARIVEAKLLQPDNTGGEDENNETSTDTEANAETTR